MSHFIAKSCPCQRVCRMSYVVCRPIVVIFYYTSEIILLSQPLQPRLCISSFSKGRLLSFLSMVPHGSKLDFSNAFLGIVYYSVIFFLEWYSTDTLHPGQGITLPFIFTLNCLAMTTSVYLAMRLVQLKELCLLCWSTHCINFLLLRYFGGHCIMLRRRRRRRTMGPCKNK